MSTGKRVAEALGAVVGRLPRGGEARPGQIEMAEAVAGALADGGHLVVRAGTGTGKSLGYLVPAVLSKKRVVVATATKALQDQLASKDLPLVAGALAPRLRFAVLKGRSNYLCRQRLREMQASGAAQRLELSGEGSRDRGEPEPSRLGAEARAVAEWASSTGSGDRAELAQEPDPRVWSSFSVGSEECPGASRCPSGGDCFAELARERAAQAQIVVVNLHLLGADLASGGAVLPEHDALVVDEAHELEDVLTRTLGVEIGPGRLRAVALAARAALGPTDRPAAGGRRRGAGDGPGSSGGAEQVLEAAARLEEVISSRAGERLVPGSLGTLGEAVELARATLERLGAELRRALDAGTDRAGSGEAVQRLTRVMLAVGHLREQLARLEELEEGEVAWVEDGPRPALEIAPVDVAPVLAEQVFARMPVVLTSATVPAGLAVRLGAEPERVREIDVGSPFAYEQNALLYCAAELPDRRSRDSEAAIVEELACLISAAGGRALALFTSRGAMERAAGALRGRLTHPILVQGEQSKAALLEAFSETPEACLFATMSFWQGVDVPGATLSLVAIDRLPFQRPDDPLAEARRERAGRDAFRTIDLPRAACLLAQGAGRLIRTASDRGVVAVLDPRLARASYRWELVRALPPMRRTRDRSEAEAFLRAIDEEASASDAPARPGAGGGWVAPPAAAAP